ncbi:MaoC family dehydratase [Azospirillum rugosum]|uniref:Acyl dehydratase n=1 Tax=Azospirillum rugosum TaxID=416170 RepID=A0ABS4SHP5_9PROT|nr:MaoC family dehydratase [Azospirillum rugosum]MBP2292096.1 acyl dehydratase [Azospirillum rugosum]MDQ0525768.1 acyl dehydratase [Azospirillum rugosum]
MRYLDDLTPGDRFAGGPVTVTAEDIVAYARQFDPQPFHLDAEAAKDTVFTGLAASGWHTAGLTMRMIVNGEGRLAGGFVGMGVEELRWPKATRPGDTLRIESEVLEVRVSERRPDRGIARVRTTTFNQDDETVQVMTANLLVPRRADASANATAPAE